MVGTTVCVTGDCLAAGELSLQTDPGLSLPAGMNRVGWEIPATFLRVEPGGKAVVEAVVDEPCSMV